jgi:hypothetical protein
LEHVLLKQVKKKFFFYWENKNIFVLDLSQIPINSIRHEFLNETNVRLNWFEHPFHVQVRLKNLETNLFEYPIENNQKSALFIHLLQASIYQIEFNISKRNYSSLIQITNYFIQTGLLFYFLFNEKLFYLDLNKLIIENILRLSENTLIINLNQMNLSRIKIVYCIEQIINDNSQICSTSNIFHQLIPGSIYNISVNAHRDSFRNIFFWKKQTIFKLVNTSESQDFIFIKINTFSFFKRSISITNSELENRWKLWCRIIKFVFCNIFNRMYFKWKNF